MEQHAGLRGVGGPSAATYTIPIVIAPVTNETRIVEQNLTNKYGLGKNGSVHTTKTTLLAQKVRSPRNKIMARITVKIGDIFSRVIETGQVRFFHLVAVDERQLNSHVIRVYKKYYSPDSMPDLLEVVNGDVDFYAHCDVKYGAKLNLWEKAGHCSQIEDLSKVLFRGTRDYGSGADGVRIDFSTRWYVWHISDQDFTYVGKLEGEMRNAFIGLVFSVNGIVAMLDGKKYLQAYPGIG